MSLSLSIENAVANPIKERKIIPLIYDFNNWKSKHSIEKAETIFKFYPSIKDRFFWFNEIPLDQELAMLFTAFDEIQSPSYLNEFNLTTCISEQYFHGKNSSWKVEVMPDAIETQTILTFLKTTEGKRRDRMLVESSKFLFNNPFLSFEDFYRHLMLINNLIFDLPLYANEIQDIATYQFKNFINGKMTFPKPKLKTVFYSTITVIESPEKRRITSTETYKRKKQENIRAIKKAIQQLESNSEKATQKKVAHMVNLSVRTVKTLWDLV